MDALRRNPTRWLLFGALALVAAVAAFHGYEEYRRSHLAITRATCQRIRPGMTEADVAALVGSRAAAYASRPTHHWPLYSVGRVPPEPDEEGAREACPVVYAREWSDDHGLIWVVFGEDGRVRQWAYAPVDWQDLGPVEKWVRMARSQLGI